MSAAETKSNPQAAFAVRIAIQRIERLEALFDAIRQHL